MVTVTVTWIAARECVCVTISSSLPNRQTDGRFVSDSSDRQSGNCIVIGAGLFNTHTHTHTHPHISTHAHVRSCCANNYTNTRS